MEFEEFVREELPGLVRFAAVLTGDRTLADDLVQESLIRAKLHWRRVQRADRPDLYLRRIVVNANVTWQRRWYQRVVRPVADLGHHDRGSTNSADPVDRADRRHAADPAEHTANATTITAGLTRLTRPQQVAIVLRYYEDRDDHEIAKILGCAPSTVRSHLARGLHALRVDLDDRQPQEIPR